MPSGSYHIAVGIAQRDNLGAELLGLFGGVDGHVARAGDDNRLAVKGSVPAALRASSHEIDQAVSGGLRTGQGAAVGQALAGKHALVQAGDALILAVEIADLTPADADIAGRARR